MAERERHDPAARRHALHRLECAALRIEPQDDDLERLVVASLTAPVVGHSVIYGVSDNATSWWDNSSAKHIGYRPQDSSEPFRAAAEARQPTLDTSDPATIYQGGGFVAKGPYED